MPKNYWNVVNKVIYDADVILLLLDARLVNETRNPEIESKVKKSEKILIYVITKCDLVDKELVEKWKEKLKPCVFVSAKDHLGTTMLRDRIIIEAKKQYGNKKPLKVGVLGYPNVGKSSLINSMKGRHSAPVSPMSGYTRGVQKVRADNYITFLDTPGVIPYMEKDPIKHAFIGTIDYTKAHEPDIVVMELMANYPGKIEAYYNVDVIDDKEEELELIAGKNNILKKGGIPDIARMGRMILKDWQTGKIK